MFLLLQRYFDAPLDHLSLDTGIAQPSLNTARRSKADGPEPASPSPRALSRLHPLSSASALLLAARGWLSPRCSPVPCRSHHPPAGLGFRSASSPSNRVCAELSVFPPEVAGGDVQCSLFVPSTGLHFLFCSCKNGYDYDFPWKLKSLFK